MTVTRPKTRRFSGATSGSPLSVLSGHSAKPELLVGLALLAIFTLLAWLTDWDRSLSLWAYYAGDRPWYGQQQEPWSLLYRFGEAPSYIFGSLSLAAYAFSKPSAGNRGLRSAALFFALAWLLGPGLLVNTLGKGLMGRPRPVETLGLGGAWEFLRPFELGIPGRGRSFLSGHASAGFFWMSLYFVWQGPKRWLGLALGVSAGLLLGWARIIQGGHYLSDVLLCGAALFSLQALLSPLTRRALPRGFWLRKKVLLAMLAAALGYSLCGRPIYEERFYTLGLTGAQPGQDARERLVSSQVPDLADLALDLALEGGDISVSFESVSQTGRFPMLVEEQAQALALPTGKLVLLQDAYSSPPSAGPIKAGMFLRQSERLLLVVQARYLARIAPERGMDLRLKTEQGRISMGPWPAGRKVLLSGTLSAAQVPPDFKPFGQASWLRDGAEPLINVQITSPNVDFAPSLP